MNSVDTQIKKAYEEEGMTPSQIAQDQSFDEGAVKAKLMQVSSKYRKDCGKEPEEEDVLNFTNDQLAKANDVIFMCATAATLPDGTPDFRTMSKNAQYIRDDKKGRKEVVKNIQGNTFNLLDMNAMMMAAKQGAEKIKGAVTGNNPNKAIEA